MSWRVAFLLLGFASTGFCARAVGAPQSMPPEIPPPEIFLPENFLKEKSLARAREELKAVVNAAWEKEDFVFVAAAFVRAPLFFTRPKAADLGAYRNFTDAIKRLDYDPRTKIAEIRGEKAGLALHSWIQMNDEARNVIRLRVIRGDLAGMAIDTHLWEERNGTLIIGRGELRNARSGFSKPVALALPAVAEFVIDVATNNFRSYIEKEHQKNKLKKTN